MTNMGKTVRDANEKERKQAVQAWIKDPNNQPQAYKDAVALRDAIKNELFSLDKAKQTIHKSAREAANNMLAGLEVTLEKWKRDTAKSLEVKVTEYTLLDAFKHADEVNTSQHKIIGLQVNSDFNKDCSDVVNANKEAMLKDRKLSKLEKFVNAVLEACGFDKFFKQKDTLLGLKEDITKKVEALEERDDKNFRM